jgi:hypothetical protein
MGGVPGYQLLVSAEESKEVEAEAVYMGAGVRREPESR